MELTLDIPYQTPTGNKMKTKNIKVIIKNEHKEVTVKYDPRKLIMTFSEADNFKKFMKGMTYIYASQKSEQTSRI